jgi:phosphoglycolate phosphatase-like HAD superfamily hydrolase
MGFQDYMSRAGRFITEAEAEERVQEMRRVRESLLERLEYENKKNKAQHDKLVQAHNEVVEEKQRAKQKNGVATSPAITTATVAATSTAEE